MIFFSNPVTCVPAGKSSRNAPGTYCEAIIYHLCDLDGFLEALMA